MTAELSDVEIFTDGACKGNPGPGGWGAILKFGDVEKELKGGEAHTTNNRMELMAAISALLALKKPCTVDLYTDSQYVRNGITAGASAPELLVREVVDCLAGHFAVTEEPVEGVEERMIFKLPAGLEAA